MTGFEIHARQRAVSKELVEKFRQVPVANVSDCMSRMTAGGARLRPMHDGTPLAGPALTVRTRPGDNLLVHKALSLAQPGDVIVVDAGGERREFRAGPLPNGGAQHVEICAEGKTETGQVAHGYAHPCARFPRTGRGRNNRAVACGRV